MPTYKFKPIDEVKREMFIRMAKEEGEARGVAIGVEKEREKWQTVVADKDAEIARLRAMVDEK